MTDLHAISSTEELVDKLRGILEKKSYLVVLDDVWKREAITDILPALPLGNIDNGSKIIITTRNKEIINLQQSTEIHESRPLSEDEGWELFSKIALCHRKNYNVESFESLGKEMLEKCDGLPLAIIALAGILSTRGNIGEWLQVREAVRSRVMEGSCSHMHGRVGDILALSYDDLPCYLKPCFLHLAVFPEDCQIPAGLLTRMWIAEGLVTASEELDLEDVAMQRLEELGHRFMIQVVRTNFQGEIKAIHLHDLLHDLCVKKAKEQTFLQIYTPINDPPPIDASPMTILPRRAALHSSEDGTLITVAELRPPEFVSVIGKLNTSYLSPNVTYEIVWVIRVVEKYGLLVDEVDLEAHVDTKITLSAEGKEKQVVIDGPFSFHGLTPATEWIRIEAGEFEVLGDMMEDLVVSLDLHQECRRVTLIIKGFSIEPKL